MALTVTYNLQTQKCIWWSFNQSYGALAVTSLFAELEGRNRVGDSCAYADEGGRHLYSIPAESYRWGGTPLIDPVDF